MSKHKKKDKDKKKNKNSATAGVSLEDEVKKLREENEELRRRLEKIAEMTRFGAPSDVDDDEDEEEEPEREGVHPL